MSIPVAGVQERLTRQLQAPVWATLPVAAATGAAWLVAFSIAVAALVRHRPLPHVGLLLLAGIPILVIGQLFAIATTTGGKVNRTGRARPSFRASFGRSHPSGREFFFSSLPPAVGRGFVAVFVAGWLLAMTAWPGADHGSQDSATAGCPYRLSNHGSYSCVTDATYLNAGAEVQRFGAGVLSGFFALQCGSALNSVVARRRRPD